MFTDKFNLAIIISIVVIPAVYTINNDAYIEESKSSCFSREHIFSCAKYRLLKYITNYTDSSIITNLKGPVKLVKIRDIDDEVSLFDETPRFISGDGEFSKFLKFVQRQVNYFTNHQGIVIPIPPGARLVAIDGSDLEESGEADYDDASYKNVVAGRGKKKKLDMLLQMVTLFKVFKIKVLVALVLAGIIVIKKVLLVAAFILPGIIHNLKMQCRAAAIASQHSQHHHFEDHGDEHPVFGGFSSYAAGGGAGGGGGGGGYGHSAYGNDDSYW